MSRRVLVAVLAAGALLTLPSAAPAASTTIVISELRTRGPAGGNDEFVELRNISNASVSVGGWALQGCAGGSGAASNRAVIPAATEIPAGGSYLFTNSLGYSGSVPGDQTYGTGIADDGGVRIANAGVGIDGVASQDPNPDQCREGTGLTFPGANADNGFERIGGSLDTDRNNFDFTGPKASDPQNSSSEPEGDAAPRVASTDPRDGELGADPDGSVTVTFSEPVTTGADPFSLACSDGSSFALSASSADQATYTLDPDGSLPLGESCALTVHGGAVADVDAQDPPDAMTGDATITFFVRGLALRIHDIQGADHRSPHEGKAVDAVPGVVTARRNNGFWMQDAGSDDDPATSEGIFVFTASAPTVTVGAAVTVSGLVAEFRPGGADADNLTTTELERVTVASAGAGAAIAPTVIGAGGRVPPNQVIEDDASGSVETSGLFDFGQDGIDFYESLEGMKLQLNDAVAVGPTNGFGEVFVVGDDGANAGVRTNRGGVVISPGDFNPERIQLDDVLADTPDMHVGDRLPGATVGVLSYDFGNFELLPLVAPAAVPGGIVRETTQAPRNDELSIATFNVENLDPSDRATIPRLARLVVENMRSPDLVAIEEMQDDNGAVNDGTTAATLSWRAFIDAVAAAGGPVYDYRQIDPENNQDGGQPGGNIRVGFLFRTDRGLSFVDRGQGDATTPTGVFRAQGRAHLTLSPGRVDPQDPAWTASRKPLAGEFKWKGRTLLAIANHFASKGGDDPLFGRWQPPIRSTEVQRHAQAAVVNGFVKRILASDKNAYVAVLGDINDFEFSETTQILEGDELVSLLHGLPKPERYSYVFEGNSQVLDQILVSKAALATLHGFDAVHVNAEFFDQASDHDPSVARLAPEDAQ
ncbi:MAG TPA: Ig-like domain-containing protein [Acidimicrobiia bacterium]|nr:Ig-like domain-containing protein [Acidimicrobiia bacterium]